MEPITDSIDWLIEAKKKKVVPTERMSAIKKFFNKKVFINCGKCINENIMLA